MDAWIVGTFGDLDTGSPHGPNLSPSRHHIHPAFDSEFEVFQTVGDGTCLLHSFLTNISATYRSMTDISKMIVGGTFRRYVYGMLYAPGDRLENIHPDDYREVRHLPIIQARIEHPREGFTTRTVSARGYIQNTSNYLGDEDTKKLQECFGVRIIIVTKTGIPHGCFRLVGEVNPGELAEEFDREHTAMNNADGEHPLTRYMLIFQKASHYEAVRRKGVDQFIFTYPEVRDIIEASVDPEVVRNPLLRALFLGAEGDPPVPVTVRGRGPMRVGPSGIHWIDEDRADGVHLVPEGGASAAAGPVEELVPMRNILTVRGHGFRLADYQPERSPRSPRAPPGSPQSRTPPLDPNAVLYPYVKPGTRSTRRSPPRSRYTRRAPSPPRRRRSPSPRPTAAATSRPTVTIPSPPPSPPSSHHSSRSSQKKGTASVFKRVTLRRKKATAAATAAVAAAASNGSASPPKVFTSRLRRKPVAGPP